MQLMHSCDSYFAEINFSGLKMKFNGSGEVVNKFLKEIKGLWIYLPLSSGEKIGRYQLILIGNLSIQIDPHMQKGWVIAVNMLII